MNRPGAEEDFPTIYHVPCLADEDAHPAREATIQLDPVDHGVADNCQVGPTARWLEVGVICRDSLLVAQIARGLPISQELVLLMLDRDVDG